MQKKEKQSFVRAAAIVLAVYLALTALFYWIVADDWRENVLVSDSVTAERVLGELTPGAVVTQTFVVDTDRLDAIGIDPGETKAEETGMLHLTILDGEEPLWTLDVPYYLLKFNQLNQYALEPGLTNVKGKRLSLRIEAEGTGLTLWAGSTMSAGKFDVSVQSDEVLSMNGEAQPGQLVLVKTGTNLINADRYIWPVALVFGALAALLFAAAKLAANKGKYNILLKIRDLVIRYRYLLKQLVVRDFKVKYKASVLGMFWSFLNPLLSMTVYYFVFSTIFRSNITYFPAYLLTGIVMFNYYSDATNLGLNAIVGNSGLITKVYMPKYIYPLSKVLSSAINLIISFIPLLLVMLVTGVPFSKSLLLLPLVVFFLVVYCLGMSLILSTLMVFFRDTQFLWSVLLTMWNFLTPIFYPESIIPAAFKTLYHMNPLYQIVYFMRCIAIEGISPNPITYLYCCLAAFIPLLIGLWVFRKNQDRFVLYL